MVLLEFKFIPDSGHGPHARGWIICHPHEGNDEKDWELSPELATADEVEHHVERLKHELDRIVRQAKKSLD